MIVQVVPVVDHSVRGLCVRPYPGHKKGCPNFGKRGSCPPSARFVEDVIDLSKPVFAVYNVFDLGAHVAKMKLKHPGWSVRQLRNCLYWQGGARKRLRELVRESVRDDTVVLFCPEACGVDVTETMRNAGVVLEWPPVNLTYQVALVGVRK